MTNTPHTSGDSVAAPTISEAQLDEYEEMAGMGFVGLGGKLLLQLVNEIRRLRSASAAPVEGVLSGEQVAELQRDFPSCGWRQKWPDSSAAEAPTGEIFTAEFQQTGAPLHDMVHRPISATREGEVCELLTTWLSNDEHWTSDERDAFRRRVEAALRTDTAPGLPAQAAKSPTCGGIAPPGASPITEDAARYRWLRSHETEALGLAFIGIAGPGGISRFTNEHADAAIDAARLSKGERGRGEAPLSRGYPA